MQLCCWFILLTCIESRGPVYAGTGEGVMTGVAAGAAVARPVGAAVGIAVGFLEKSGMVTSLTKK